MADYVRETILSQGYAHIETVELTDEQKAAYQLQMALYQEGRAKVILGAGVKPEVKTKDGSLIVYTTVYGSLADALGEIKGEFIDAINVLYASSKMLADACILESLFLSQKPRKNLKRSEARTGVVKTTKTLFDRVSYLAHRIDEEREKRIVLVLNELERKMDFLNDQLREPKDRVLVWSQFLPHLDKLPKRPALLANSPDQIALNTYTARIKSLKKKVKDLIG
ncbi:hypothetical protein [Burkholderia vietnamiensis]|uniref:hypothetical protein n=1 Tax=Burkholderia vietnamiensis TaxID=60552 RepID=UPI0012D94939|nr:hypothetical protein [Burkholderia vietnamiensis]